MAARIQAELGIDVELIDGPFGRAAALVAGEKVAGTGLSGWLPPARILIERIRVRLNRTIHESLSQTYE